IANGCGGTIPFGMCPGAQDLCVDNQCVCQPKTAADFPTAQCGSMPNGCGGTIMFGTCTGAQQLCVSNECVCQPKTCADFAGMNLCGQVPDGCGGLTPTSCGSCGQFELCGTAN